MKKIRSILLCLALIFATCTVAMAKPFSSAEWVYGDVDFSRRIDATDALWILLLPIEYAGLMYSLDPNCKFPRDYELTVENNPQFLLYDLNHDYQIDAQDSLLALQYSVKLIDSFPVDGVPLPPHE